jgi:predicted ATP-grasp superfamily ATP-dependent carboligase
MVAFVAAGGRAAPLAICAQLIGERAFGGAGYRCGNILPNGDVTFTRTLDDAVAGIVRAIAEAFGLIGVNGIDFVIRDGVPYPVEVNPRWTASMELVEAAHGISVFDAHARACNSGELPAFDAARARRESVAFGKAIIYAQQMVHSAIRGRGWVMRRFAMCRIRENASTLDARSARSSPQELMSRRAGER